MKKTILFLTVVIATMAVNAQNCYWVLLRDKAGSTFDPYSYFDAKAIERYKLNNADLYDVSNYPLSESYVNQIGAIASEEVGQSRWLNAVAVMATESQIKAIEALPFVSKVDLIATNMEIAECLRLSRVAQSQSSQREATETMSDITTQLARMKGERFVENGIDGKGVRIAVLDGGFKAVNTHEAFKHLRDNNRIIATWDFTKKQENVYDNHTHGTMVLSCIAGQIDGKQLGLATGATFLLAKTEVDPEPFKEEVWWAQAMEWADKNGADIINSSLGYTQDRHYTWEMDGRSYVSKAANMAARKGMLVCNSAGNSGDDKNWKIIGAPADADSILSVGGINPSLNSYSHIDFSSYGPTADGRMKPNVCNFGYCEVADANNNQETDFAYGTSFSSPLTAGFCACAWQTKRDKTAMQMKSLIEQSADLYPYYDYALGYGVPQADFFVEKKGEFVQPEPTFTFKALEDYILIHPTAKGTNEMSLKDGEEKESVVLLKIQDRNGKIKTYGNIGIPGFNDQMYIAVAKSGIVGYTLVAYVDGYTDGCRLTKQDSMIYAEESDHSFVYYLVDTNGIFLDGYDFHGERDIKDNAVSNWGVGQKYNAEVYYQYGISWFFPYTMRYSDVYTIGFHITRNFRKWYGLGVGMEFVGNFYRYDPSTTNIWDITLAIADFTNVDKKRYLISDFNLELFQRIRIKNTGKNEKGLFWDLGVYGGLQSNSYQVLYNEQENNNAAIMQENNYYGVEPISMWNLGLTTRIVWNWIGVFGRYRLTQPDLDLPKLQVGIHFTF
ncbi:MAG: S8 family serine peptidase [Bacteroidales bacterium]|nr:S8 family serine peptidase [Bacteroidales bacterium]